ncbi:MAG: zf-HC2 domain-containing protein [Candidatus Hydrogenedentes bacterium]|nr:zf-HC2 domain-containing protein [Candidatus Hydrogenedentota bacterium]
MECRHIRMNLPAFLDGDLSPDSRWIVEDHLEWCPACAEELADLNDFNAGARLCLECPAPAPEFHTIQTRLHTIDPLEEVVAFLPRLKIRRAVPRLVVACFFLFLAGGSQYLLRHAWQILAQGRVAVETHRLDLEARLADALDPQAAEDALGEDRKQA